MINNPFLSETFTETWKKHHIKNKPVFSFPFFPSIWFYKSSIFPLYTNIGKNITNGMSYSIDALEDIKNNSRAFLIYDVPSYYGINNCESEQRNLGCYRVRQYKGYLASLKEYESFEEFFKNQFKSKSRYNLRKHQKRLDNCFKVDFKFYYGEIDKTEYEKLMYDFKTLISKRFGELGLDNDVLSSWEYYEDLAYKMILDKRAVLMAVYNENDAMGFVLNFLSQDIAFYSITTFNSDYSSFNIGNFMIMNLIQWCFDNNVDIMDFSKGTYDYKKRWSNQEYNFEVHILYNNEKVKSKVLAWFIAKLFTFKQFLRDRNVNHVYVKLKYYLKDISNLTSNKKKYKVRQAKINSNIDKIHEINLNDEKYSYLKPIVFHELYLKPEPIEGVKAFKTNKGFVICGSNNSFVIESD